MKRTIAFLIFVLIAGAPRLAAQAPSGPWSGVLSSSRAINWSNAGVPGGIPSATWTQCGTTIAAYGTSSVPASPATIQTVINGCGANQFVQLGAGSFYLSGSIYVKNQSNIEIRGMGANSTFIYFYGASGVGGDNCNGLYALICFESGDNSFFNNGAPVNFNGPIAWTAGYSQGTTVITLASVANLKIGNPIILNQEDTPSDTGAIIELQDCLNPPGTSFVAPGNAGPHSAQCGQIVTGYDQVHTYTVAGCNGSTTPGTACTGTNVAVTISPGLEESNWSSSLSPQAFWNTSPFRNVGLQNLSLDGGNTGCSVGSCYGVAFTGGVNFWERGVRDTNESFAHTEMQYVARGTIRDNYQFLARYSTSTSYGVNCAFVSSDILIENNFFQAIAGPVLLSEGCAGIVVDYNYAVNDYFSVPNFVNPMISIHAVNDDLNLFEGNVGALIDGDVIHGTHNLNSFFRNYMTSVNPVCWLSSTGTAGTLAYYLASTWGSCTPDTALYQYANNRFPNIIGNVLGQTGITTGYITNADTGNYAIALGSPDNHDGRCNGGVAGPACEVPYDTAVQQTAFPWGNCDPTNGGTGGTPFTSCTFNPAMVPVTANLATSQQAYAQFIPSSHALPASFVYSSAPSWWPTGKPFPIIGPDVTGGNISGVNGLAYTNPAEDCYLSLAGATTNGTGGPFPFDANTCYGKTNTTPQAPPEPQGFLMAIDEPHTSYTFTAGVPTLLAASDGLWYTPNGANPINLASAPAPTSISINGTAKTCTPLCSFLLTGAAPDVAVAAPAITIAPPAVAATAGAISAQ